MKAGRSQGSDLKSRNFFTAFVDYFGAQDVPDLKEHELDRVSQRIVGTVVVALLWFAVHFIAHPDEPKFGVLIALSAVYLVKSLAYRRLLLNRPGKHVVLLYLFLLLDPIYLTGALLEDPEIFAFLSPFLLVVIVRSGIRYGIRTMYLSWVVTLAASAALLASEFWRTNVELTLTLAYMLALVPAYFAHLIRHVHVMRATERENARLASIKDSVEARNQFLSKISHEIRSPLQTLLSSLDLFNMRHRRGLTDDEQDELSGQLRRSALLLNTQLRDLLTLAKGEAGRLELDPQPFEVGALLEAMVDGARDYAASKGLGLVLDLPHETLFVVADGARIDQILNNLVLNSIRYTEAGQVRVVCHPYSPERRMLRFSVADSGPGIPRSVVPTLLEPDRMMPSAGRGQGSGIGLAVVRTLIGHLDGQISILTDPATGTTVTVEIPAEPATNETHAHTAGGLSGKVLVVDDRRDVLDTVASVVDELGFECDQASSIAVAINLLATRRYDTVLLDVQMPIKSGAELAADLRRSNGRNRTSRLIGMSAAEMTDAVKKEFDTCLAKPIESFALRQALLVAIPSSRPSQSALWVDEGGMESASREARGLRLTRIPP